MVKIIQKRLFSILLVISLFCSFAAPVQASAMSFNPVSFIQKTSNLIVRRVSDIIYYLVMQKKYIFDNFSDPNNFASLKIPPDIEEIITANITATSSSDFISGRPITVTTSTISTTSIKKIIPPPARVPSQTAPYVPVLVVKSDAVTAPAAEPIPSYNNNSLILAFTNAERAQLSLPSLKANYLLDEIAGLRADDLFANQYFEHESPTGNSASDLAKNLGYDYLLIGENLALGDFGDEQGIVSAWMGSPGHKANILNDNYEELGVSIKTGFFKGENTTIAVQIFARPLSDCPRPNQNTKVVIDNSSVTIEQMQTTARTMFETLTSIKNNPEIDRSYYNQKIYEYNYYAKTVNDAIIVLKGMIDSYNAEVNNYNACINN
jgi:uncharacterized protein YkwD